MLRDLVDRLVDLGRSSSRWRHFTVDGLPRRVFLENPQGELVEREIESRPRAPWIYSLYDLIEFASKVGDEPEFYVSEDAVQVVLKGADRHETAIMPLRRTEAFLALRSLRDVAPSFTPAQAIQFLRFQCPGAHAEPVIQHLRRVDFSRRSTGRSTTEHGKESLGRSVEAEVQQRESIPPEFYAEVPVYGNQGLVGMQARVRVGIHLDLEGEKIALRPLADELEGAVRCVLVQILSVVAHEIPEVLVVLGEPQRTGATDLDPLA